jgi:hypothetical protein
MLEHELGGLFAAGGTGEFFSLTPDKVTKVMHPGEAVRTIIAADGGATPRRRRPSPAERTLLAAAMQTVARSVSETADRAQIIR